jgi:excinuclease ABC subunit C
VQDLKLFMEGKRTDLVKRLERENERRCLGGTIRAGGSSPGYLCEPLANLRSRNGSLPGQVSNADVFALHREDAKAAAQLFHLRGGKVVDRREFFWEDLMASTADGEILSSLLKQYYFNSEFTPDEVFVPADFEDRQLLEDFLSQRRGKRVEIKIPQRGVKRTFVDLVNQNAKLSFDQRFRVLNPSGSVISEGLASALGLETAPRRIECFDISNIQGTDSVASMVVWEDGKMKKSDYRKFIIKTVEGADDFRSIREVVFRRYKRLQDEGTPMPIWC